MLTQKSVNEIFHVPEFNLPKLQAAVKALNKKVSKLGLDKSRKIYATTTGFETIRRDGKALKVYEVHVTGDVLGVDGYTFLGRISHDKSSGNMVRSVPGQQIPQEFWDRCECDHCRYARHRKDTFVVRNDDTGKVLQIGRACLKDFFGHDPEKIAKIAEWFIQFTNGNSWGFDGSWTEVNTLDVQEYIGYVVRELNESNWISRSWARSHNETVTDDNFVSATADQALSRLSSQYSTKYPEAPLTDEEIARAEVIVLWWRTQLATKSSLSEFDHNTKVIVENTVMQWRDTGYVAAVVNLYNKEFFPKVKVEKVESQHIGSIGDKISVTGKVTSVRWVDGDFGRSRVARITTEEGNIVSFWNGNFDVEENETVSITGKVKAHKEFAAKKETVLNYVKRK